MTTPALFRPAALTAALLSATLLAGCSAAGASSSSAGSASEAAPAVSESGVRAVTHARGTTEVPDHPQRVVVLEPVQLDTAVALDVVPVGAAVVSATAGVPAYLGVGDRVEPVGTVSEPDLEAIAALAPDLILGTEARHSKLYDQLSQIAPTVFQKSQTDPWQDSVRLVGEALGEPDAATAALSQYTDRCEQVRAAHPHRRQDRAARPPARRDHAQPLQPDLLRGQHHRVRRADDPAARVGADHPDGHLPGADHPGEGRPRAGHRR
ncbi:MAG: ABC transporter substrate-binding protein [Quadrisphaera sp.]